MATDARILTSLPGHPKTKRLIRRLGPGAGWYLIRLFLWATESRSDGDLTGLTSEDIELAVDWTGENDALVHTLVEVGFLDGDEGRYQIHDWAEHNPWVNGAEQRSARARWNAVKRHHGAQEADRQVPEYASVRHANSNGNDASSTQDDADSTQSVAGGINSRGSHHQPVTRPKDASSTENDASSNAPSPSPSPSPKAKALPPHALLPNVARQPSPSAGASESTPEDSQLPANVDPERWASYRDQLADDGKLSISRIKTALMQLRRVSQAGHDPNAVLTAAVMRGLRDLDDCALRLAREKGTPTARAGPSSAAPMSKTLQTLHALEAAKHEPRLDYPSDQQRLAKADPA